MQKLAMDLGADRPGAIAKATEATHRGCRRERRLQLRRCQQPDGGRREGGEEADGALRGGACGRIAEVAAGL